MLGRALIAITTMSAVAHGDPCASEARQRRDVLAAESADADAWNLEWRLGFTALALTEAGVALTASAAPSTRTASWVGASESGLAAVLQWALPLRVEVPARAADACTDAELLRAAEQRAGQQEQGAFWIGHGSVFAVNAIGSIVLAERTSWQNGATSFVIGYAIGLLHVYTMPRRAWHALPIATENGLAIAGTF